MQDIREGDRGEAAFRQSLSLFEPFAGDKPAVRLKVADLHNHLGQLALAAGRFAAADVEFRMAQDICDRITAADPTSMDAQIGVSEALFGRLSLHVFQGQREDDDASIRRLVSIRELRSASYPASHEWAAELADALVLAARLHVDRGRLDEAEAEARRRWRYASRCATTTRKCPTTAVVWRRHVELAAVHQQRGNRDNARTECGRALSVLEPLVRKHPLTPLYQRDLAVAGAALAEMELDRGNPTAALTLTNEAFRLAEPLLNVYPPEPSEWEALSKGFWCRAEARVRLGRAAESLPDWSNALKMTAAGTPLSSAWVGPKRWPASAGMPTPSPTPLN